MGGLADMLGQVSASAESPDGNISARLRGRAELTLGFRPGSYRRYDERELAHQLGQLAAVVFVRYRRDYTETMDAYASELVEPVGAPDPKDAEFAERLRQLEVAGVAPQATVELRSRGLVSWDVTIAGGALGRLGEDQFLAEVHGAVASVLADYRARVFLLRDEIYDVGVPPWWRDSADPRYRERARRRA